ncbi:MAG TPA: IS110 family transposase [Thermoanaerobaculia bacterium]
MEHLAIDLGGRESQICVRDTEGTILEEKRCPTASLKKYLAGRPQSRVVLETCAEAFAVAEAARGLGHDVKVVPATLVRALGVGARGLKTDVRDARNLSEASCRMARLPAVHIPSAGSRERKSICGLRENLVEVRTKLVNGVRGWMRSEGLGTIRTGCPESLPSRVIEHLKQREREVPPWVSRNLTTIDHLSKQVGEADAELRRLARADPTCRRLMTVPGVGPVTAVRFAAAVDDVSRFSSAHALESYLGLTPGERSSGERQHSTGITKAGSPKLRWTLIQAAWSAWRHRRQDPMVLWALRVQERRGKTIAVVALARKMAGILFALWRDGSAYDPKHQTGEVEMA